jgi:hypothetical protein
LLKDVQHVDLLFKMGVVQIAFRILTHFFMQWSIFFYNAHFFLPPL